MEESKYLYIVFSVTPYKIGKFIRFVTRFSYNHVSVGLTSDLKKLYSFARFFKNAPLYGGFTEESVLRFENKGKHAAIKVCAIPVDDEQYNQIDTLIKSIKARRSNYVYNIISAIFTPVKKRVFIPYSFTCAEFVVELLSNFNSDLKINPHSFYSIEDLSMLLNKYKIYEGSSLPYAEAAVWGDDLFLEKKSLRQKVFLTAYSYWTVLKLYLTS